MAYGTNKKTLYFIFLSVFLVLTLTVSVYAEDPDVDLLDLPNALATVLGIDTVSAGVMLAIFVIAPFNVCLLLYRKIGTIAIILNFIFLGFFTSIGWIPNWTILLVALILAGLYAVKIKGMI